MLTRQLPAQRFGPPADGVVPPQNIVTSSAQGPLSASSSVPSTPIRVLSPSLFAAGSESATAAVVGSAESLKDYSYLIEPQIFRPLPHLVLSPPPFSPLCSRVC